MNYPTLQVIRQPGSFRQIANALGWSLTARRLVELATSVSLKHDRTDGHHPDRR